MTTLELILSVLTYGLWFGPLLALVVWALWKLAHVSHHAAMPEPAVATPLRHHASPPMAPLAHG